MGNREGILLQRCHYAAKCLLVLRNTHTALCPGLCQKSVSHPAFSFPALLVCGLIQPLILACTTHTKALLEAITEVSLTATELGIATHCISKASIAHPISYSLFLSWNWSMNDERKARQKVRCQERHSLGQHQGF